MRDLEAIAEARVRCHRITCQAGPGFRCITTSGALATRAHSDRTRALEEAWRIGFVEGGTTVVNRIERECNPDRADLEPRATLERAIKRVRGWLL